MLALGIILLLVLLLGLGKPLFHSFCVTSFRVLHSLLVKNYALITDITLVPSDSWATAKVDGKPKN